MCLYLNIVCVPIHVRLYWCNFGTVYTVRANFLSWVRNVNFRILCINDASEKYIAIHMLSNFAQHIKFLTQHSEVKIAFIITRKEIM